MPVALVTGSGIRVGRAIALALGRAGFDLLLHANRSVEDAQNLAEELHFLERSATVVQADLSRIDGPATLAKQCGAKLDVLVNSAAAYAHANFADITAEQLERMWAVNVRAPFLLTQALLPALQGGCIINITDMAVSHAYTPTHFFSHYLATKAALEQLTRAWALELGPGIRVNAVAPGPVAMAAETNDAQRADILGRIPLRREGSPEDVAQAVVFLATAPYITGQTVRVDGGLSVA